MVGLLMLSAFMIASAYADTPANCSYVDIQGKWTVYETMRGHNNSYAAGCDRAHEYIVHRNVTLSFPNIAFDEYGNEGDWTLIYNQGFEIHITGRKYFMFSAWNRSSVTEKPCYETKVGFSQTAAGLDWSCVRAIKDVTVTQDMRTVQYKPANHIFLSTSSAQSNRMYKRNDGFIKAINSVQSSWTATHYDHFEKMTLGDLHLMHGGPKSKISGIPRAAPTLVGTDRESELIGLPDYFDWRDIHGVSYVSPVRNQANCGSCYAFSSAGMNEARMRVRTNNSVQLELSPQDVIECSPYSQGCSGGFPYLIAGRYATDFGMAPEKCNPYRGEDGSCSTRQPCLRSYSFSYRYVGGYYGACNEEEMKIALMRGPLSVGFEVYPDFQQYQGGVYHHTFLTDKYNPFELTNHAVLLVGWGTDAAAGPYWIVKNSWGAEWGEDGYFRIRRGNDECSIESLAVESFPAF